MAYFFELECEVKKEQLNSPPLPVTSLPTLLYLLLPSASFQERSQLCFLFYCHLLRSQGSLNALGQRLS